MCEIRKLFEAYVQKIILKLIICFIYFYVLFYFLSLKLMCTIYFGIGKSNDARGNSVLYLPLYRDFQRTHLVMHQVKSLTYHNMKSPTKLCIETSLFLTIGLILLRVREEVIAFVKYEKKIVLKILKVLLQ